MSVYGPASANDANVAYPFSDSLPAAVAAHALANDLQMWRDHFQRIVNDVGVVWRGPQKDTFVAQHHALRQSTNSLVPALEHLAVEVAASWAAARGQQDRINRARWVEWDIAQDNMLENGWEFFAGETDYGPPPADPPTPSASQFAPTRAPMHQRFGI